MKLAVVGATGVVGRMMITKLMEEDIKPKEIVLFASEKSEGSKIRFFDKEISVRKLTKEAMTAGFDFALFSAGSQTAKVFAPIAAEFGTTTIDNSSAFRKDENIPLIVPEINGDLLENYKGIIANPNCSTIQMVLALHNLDKEFGLKEVVVSSYQAVSGAGKKGIDSLNRERKGDYSNPYFPKQIDLNAIPQIGDFCENGYCEEEEKMMNETKKILRNSNLKIVATTVRVPVVNGHAESVFARFDKKIDFEKAEDLLSNSHSVQYLKNGYLTQAEIGESDLTTVCRLRKGFDEKSLVFWCVAHNLRTGAATNAVRILKKIIE